YGAEPSFTELIVPLLALAAAHFALVTLLMGSLIALKTLEPVRPLQLLKNHRVLALVYLASASISGLLYFSVDRFGAAIVIAVVPIIIVFLSTHRFYFRQMEATEQAQRQRVLAAEREAQEAARHLAELQKSESRFLSAFSHAAIGMALISADR